MTIFTINFLALVTILCAILSITSKNPVVSIIYLISTFVLAACYLILIGINFIGISYIVIYVGAIAILFLFIIMMINIKLSDILETGPQYNKNLPLSIAIGSILIIILYYIIILSCSVIFITLYADIIFNDFQQIEVLGYGIYTFDAILLITLSMILLLAIFAAIIISKPNKKSNNKKY